MTRYCLDHPEFSADSPFFVKNEEISLITVFPNFFALEEALVSFTHSNGCHAYVAESHYFSISASNLKDLFI